MVTQFNEKDMVSFGRFLLSEAREKRLKNCFDEQRNEAGKSWPTYEDLFREVSHADFCNWKHEEKMKRLKTFSFSEAMEALKMGKKVCRGIYGDDAFLFFPTPDYPGNPSFLHLSCSKGSCKYEIKHEDIEANDWLIVE